MISVFLLLLLSHVRLTFGEEDTTDDSGVRGAVPLPVFVPKLAAHQPGVQQVALMSASPASRQNHEIVFTLPSILK